jgi:phosphatidylinositol glycan class O
MLSLVALCAVVHAMLSAQPIPTLQDADVSASSASATTTTTTTTALPALSFAELLLCWLLSVVLFFGTGKSNEFSRLPITTAFVGFEEYWFWSSGAMLLANTFVGQLSVVMFVVPLLLLWRRRQPPATSSSSAVAATTATSTTSSDFARALAPAYLTVLGLYFWRTALSALNVTIQRRHLMVWAIFAPKYVYDAASGLVVIVISLVWPFVLARFV